jgi:hypothetical protein
VKSGGTVGPILPKKIYLKFYFIKRKGIIVKICTWENVRTGNHVVLEEQRDPQENKVERKHDHPQAFIHAPSEYHDAQHHKYQHP